jgi:hypothetical protein
MFKNEDRERHYGLRVGDIVLTLLMGDMRKIAEVTRLTHDNNGVMVIFLDGVENKEVAEWCRIITKVEDRQLNDTLLDYIPNGIDIVPEEYLANDHA